MANKCWNCARVANCDMRQPCDRFVKYRSSVTTKEVAALCGTSERALFRRLAMSEEHTLRWVNRTSGFTFIRVYKDNTHKKFVLEQNNVANSVKLAEALQKLKEVG